VCLKDVVDSLASELLSSSLAVAGRELFEVFSDSTAPNEEELLKNFDKKKEESKVKPLLENIQVSFDKPPPGVFVLKEMLPPNMENPIGYIKKVPPLSPFKAKILGESVQRALESRERAANAFVISICHEIRNLPRTMSICAMEIERSINDTNKLKAISRKLEMSSSYGNYVLGLPTETSGKMWGEENLRKMIENLLPLVERFTLAKCERKSIEVGHFIRGVNQEQLIS